MLELRHYCADSCCLQKTWFLDQELILYCYSSCSSCWGNLFKKKPNLSLHQFKLDQNEICWVCLNMIDESDLMSHFQDGFDDVISRRKVPLPGE